MNNLSDTFITPKEAGAILKIHEDMVCRLLRRPLSKGGLPGVKIGRGRGVWRIPLKKFRKHVGLE